MSGGIGGQLTFVIESGIEIGQLPAWLRKSKVLFQTRPKQAAREIQQYLITLMAPESRVSLVGREDDLREFASKVVPFGQSGPRLLISRGLVGVGRRSFIERATHDNISLPVGPYFVVGLSTGLEDLFMFLVDEVHDIQDRSSAAKELDAFRGMEPKDQWQELASLLLEICKGHTIPCLVDDGAMLGPDGKYLAGWQGLLKAFLENSYDEYLALVHTRRPDTYGEFEHAYLDTHVGPLDDGATVRLLGLLLKQIGMNPNISQLEELAEYVAGYPPAAHFAVALVKMYGLDIVLADKRELEEFKARRFQRYLEEKIQLTDEQWEILTYLGGERGLPFDALSQALGADDATLAANMRVLMDLSMVREVSGNYMASSPVLSALYRVKPLPTKEFYSKVAKRLNDAYWSDEGVMPTFAVIDATVHAAAMGGQTEDSVRPFVRISTLHRAAQESYYRDDYPAALEYARKAQEMGATGKAVRDRQIRETALKALVKMRQYRDAEAELAEIEALGDKRYFFLKGFLLRAQGRLDEALGAYRSALRVGDTRVSVHREIAFCFMNTGNYDEAVKACNRALALDAANPYVLDTLVSSYIGMKNYPKAKNALDELERVDVTGRFTHHRRASFYAATRQYELALDEADAAIVGDRGRFEAFGQRVNILIDAGRYDDALEALESLADQFPRSRGDVVTGLRCKSAIRQEQWREAENLWNRLEEQDQPVHQALLKRILLLKSEDRTVPLHQRQDARKKAKKIRLDLEDFDSAMSILTISDEDLGNIV
ncbi:tetratricopeptide repeat protein [Mycobacterium colombiense]